MTNSVCPECRYRFRGKGFSGIDSHWKTAHSDKMPYDKAWPLIKRGIYDKAAASQLRATATEDRDHSRSLADSSVKIGPKRILAGATDWGRYGLPYRFVKLESDHFTHVYLPLNREQFPLGLFDGYVRYEEYIKQSWLFHNDPRLLNGVWWRVETLCLYNDDPASRVDYFARLSKLLTHVKRVYEGPSQFRWAFAA